MEQWLEQTSTKLKVSQYLGVSLMDWGAIIIGAIAIGIALKFLKNRIVKKLSTMASHSVTHWDDVLSRALKRTHGIFLFVLAFYMASSAVGIEGRGAVLAHRSFVIAMFFQMALWGNEILGYGLSHYLTRKYGKGKSSVDTLSAYSVIDITAKFALWIVLFLLLLDNLGVNITALVTGLGIGGIAIALAVQNILGDIFASLTIVLDRPFEVGDYIVVDNNAGTVEAVGLKTSRVRALSGEQLIFPNRKLVESEIQNYKRMVQRRIAMKFRVDYAASPESLEKIPGLVADIIKNVEKVRFDRAHLSSLGENCIEYEVVYFVLSGDYNLHMDIQHRVFIDILKALREMKIAVYSPTPSVLIHSANVVEGSKIFGNSIVKAGQGVAH